MVVNIDEKTYRKNNSLMKEKMTLHFMQSH